MGFQRINQTTKGDQKKTQSSSQSSLPSVTTAEYMLYLQQTIGNKAVLNLLKSGIPQPKLRISQPGDFYEKEADRVAEEVISLSDGIGASISDSPPNIQKKCEGCASGQGTCPKCAEEEEEVIQRKPLASAITPLIQRQVKESTARTETVAPSPGLIVEDEAEDVRPGQMRKSEFLSELKTPVCTSAEEALSGTIWSAMGCPYIERWFEHYSQQDSQHVERALRRYAPETASVRTAREYIPIVAQRVRRGIKQWTETGEVTGVPEEFAKGGMPGLTAGGLIGGLVSGALSAVGSAVSRLVSGVGRTVSGIGRALFKGREGGARNVDDPEAVQSQLGSGYMLDGGVKSRMESAFDMSFSNVRIHTDSKASELSDRLNARAFTIGGDIAFGSGEYKPGTLIGDALIAHELAHVVQQGGGDISTGPQHKGGTEYNSLEQDADVSAVGAVVSVWGGVKGALTDIGRNAMPRLKSGLRLQRCAKKPTKGARPADFEEKREQYLKEGLDKLYAGGCGFPGEVWRYDDVYWERADDPNYVAYKPKGISPSKAIDKLFERLHLWDLDCALYPEVALLYAYRHALGDDLFDAEFSDLKLRQHETPGIEMEFHDIDSEDPATFNKLWDEAPVGSKVMWTNRSHVTIGTAWHHENAIKRFKGAGAEDARYDAHPLGKNLTEEEVKRGLAENADDFPSSGTEAEKQAYVNANIYRHQLHILK